MFTYSAKITSTMILLKSLYYMLTKVYIDCNFIRLYNKVLLDHISNTNRNIILEDIINIYNRLRNKTHI